MGIVTLNRCLGSEQKRPGANRPQEFVPESPLQKGVFGSHIFSKEVRENAHSKSAKTLWGPLARPAPFVYFRLSFTARHLRERRPGLINHVLTLPVFRSSLAGDAPHPELHPGASNCAPGLAFLLSWPFEQILGSAAPNFPTTRAKTGRTAHVFAAQAGTHRECGPTSFQTKKLPEHHPIIFYVNRIRCSIFEVADASKGLFLSTFPKSR